MPKIVHFEINADDLSRAKGFYERVFKWKIEKWEGGDYWVITSGDEDEEGIDGGMQQREEPTDQIFNYIKEVINPSIEEKHGPSKKGEQIRSVIDCQKAQKSLKWSPETALMEGLRDTIKYFQRASSNTV